MGLPSTPFGDGDQGRWVAVVRCRQGGLFQTLWVPYISFKSIRWGNQRFQYCPVHGGPDWVTPVDPATLTSTELMAATQYPPGRVP
jgi:hypothetical protein